MSEFGSVTMHSLLALTSAVRGVCWAAHWPGAFFAGLAVPSAGAGLIHVSHLESRLEPAGSFVVQLSPFSAAHRQAEGCGYCAARRYCGLAGGAGNRGRSNSALLLATPKRLLCIVHRPWLVGEVGTPRHFIYN